MLSYVKYRFEKLFYEYKYKHIIISNKVSLKSLQGHNCEFMEQSSVDSHCLVGSYVYVGKNTFITKAQIGNYVQIGSECAIGPGEHDINEFSINSIFMKDVYRELTNKEVTIGNDVWLGTHVIILRGVRIGNGAVIAAGAVLTKDAEPYGVYAGVPARLVKYRFSNDIINNLEKSSWWKYEPEEAKKIFKEIKMNLKEDHL